MAVSTLNVPTVVYEANIALIINFMILVNTCVILRNVIQIYDVRVSTLHNLDMTEKIEISYQQKNVKIVNWGVENLKTKNVHMLLDKKI